MKLKTTIVIGVIGLSVAVTVAFASLNSQRNHANESTSVQQQLPPIELQQLSAANGIIPVEILSQQTTLQKSDVVKNLSFTVRNNTDKNIRALCLAYSIRFKKSEAESKSTFFMTIESFIHKDIYEGRKLKPIMPGQEEVLEDNGETSSQDATITGVEARVDYVEFEDGTTLGVNEKGGQIILLMREGAAKYKQWLVRQYNEKGKSVAAVVMVLQNSSVSDELGFSSVYQIQGAQIYRQQMLRTYQAQGIETLEKIIDR